MINNYEKRWFPISYRNKKNDGSYEYIDLKLEDLRQNSNHFTYVFVDDQLYENKVYFKYNPPELKDLFAKLIAIFIKKYFDEIPSSKVTLASSLRIKGNLNENYIDLIDSNYYTINDHYQFHVYKDASKDENGNFIVPDITKDKLSEAFDNYCNSYMSYDAKITKCPYVSFKDYANTGFPNSKLKDIIDLTEKWKTNGTSRCMDFNNYFNTINENYTCSRNSENIDEKNIVTLSGETITISCDFKLSFDRSTTGENIYYKNYNSTIPKQVNTTESVVYFISENSIDSWLTYITSESFSNRFLSELNSFCKKNPIILNYYNIFSSLKDKIIELTN